MSRRGRAPEGRTRAPGRAQTGPRAAAPRPPRGRIAAGKAAHGGPRVPLSRKRILDAAFALVEERGLPGLTTRRLGDALGCEAMSIYHHFPNKQHLQDAMVEQVIAGIREPPAELDPIDRLRFLGREYRAMAYRHPRLFHLVALHRLNMPAGVAFIERMLRHFHSAVPDDRLCAQAFRIFGYYVIGAALDETSGYAAGPSAAEPVTEQYIVRECPQLVRAAPFFKQPYFDSTFDLGFEIMLKGIAELREALVPESRGAPKPVIHLKRSGHAL
jgi:AcrR family transcriptional regulator